MATIILAGDHHGNLLNDIKQRRPLLPVNRHLTAKRRESKNDLCMFTRIMDACGMRRLSVLKALLESIPDAKVLEMYIIIHQRCQSV